jgi:hypothetical protein
MNVNQTIFSSLQKNVIGNDKNKPPGTVGKGGVKQKM